MKEVIVGKLKKIYLKKYFWTKQNYFGKCLVYVAKGCCFTKPENINVTHNGFVKTR